ncbi:MAG: hypothetical protein RI897_2486 [Verrucomicrobiota bacterium]
MEGGERDEEGHGDTDTDDGGGFEVPEEEVEDDDGEEAAEDGGGADFIDAAFDEDGAVGDDIQPGAFLIEEALGEGFLWGGASAEGGAIGGGGGGFFLEFTDGEGDGFGDADDIGIGFLVDIDLDTFAAVGVGDHLAVALGADDAGDVADADIAAFEAEEDGFADLFEAGVFVEGADHVFRAAFLEVTSGDVDIFLSESGDDLLDGEAGADDLVMVEEDVVFLFEAAADADGGDALDGFEGAFDLEFGEAAEAAEAGFAGEAVAIAAEAEFEDGVEGGVEVEDEGLFCFAGEEDEVEFFHGFLGGFGHVGAPEEFEDDVGNTGAADTTDFIEAADDAEGFLDGAADFIFDFFGCGAGVFRADGQRGVAEVGHERDGQLAEREEPEDHGGGEHHEHRDWPAGCEMAFLLGLHQPCPLSALSWVESAVLAAGWSWVSSSAGSVGRRTLAPSLSPV